MVSVSSVIRHYCVTVLPTWWHPKSLLMYFQKLILFFKPCPSHVSWMTISILKTCFYLSKCVRFLRSLNDSSMTSTLDFNNQILRRCPPQISPVELHASTVLPKTSAPSPRKRFLKDKSAVCTHANDPRPSGKSAGWESVYRGWALGMGRRDNFICFHFCRLSKIYGKKKKA